MKWRASWTNSRTCISSPKIDTALCWTVRRPDLGAYDVAMRTPHLRGFSRPRTLVQRSIRGSDSHRHDSSDAHSGATALGSHQVPRTVARTTIRTIGFRGQSTQIETGTKSRMSIPAIRSPVTVPHAFAPARASEAEVSVVFAPACTRCDSYRLLERVCRGEATAQCLLRGVEQAIPLPAASGVGRRQNYPGGT